MRTSRFRDDLEAQLQSSAVDYDEVAGQVLAQLHAANVTVYLNTRCDPSSDTFLTQTHGGVNAGAHVFCGIGTPARGMPLRAGLNPDAKMLHLFKKGILSGANSEAGGGSKAESELQGAGDSAEHPAPLLYVIDARSSDTVLPFREVAQKLARLPLVGSGYSPLPNSEEVTFLGYSLTTQSVVGIAIALGKRVKIRNRSRLPKKDEAQLNVDTWETFNDFLHGMSDAGRITGALEGGSMSLQRPDDEGEHLRMAVDSNNMYTLGRKNFQKDGHANLDKKAGVLYLHLSSKTHGPAPNVPYCSGATVDDTVTSTLNALGSFSMKHNAVNCERVGGSQVYEHCYVPHSSGEVTAPP